MHQLNEHKMPDFLKSYIFTDGLIRRASIDYGHHGVEKSHGVVDVSVRTAPDKKWVNLHFRVEGLEGFQLRQAPHTTREVLFDGVSAHWFNGMCYLDFSRDCHARRTVADYADAEFYFIGRRCMWDQLPYSDK